MAKYRLLFYFGICAIWILLLFVPVFIIPEMWGEMLLVTDKPVFMAGGSSKLLICEMLVCLLACAALFFNNNLRLQRMISIVGLAFALFYSIGLTLQLVNGIEIVCVTEKVVAGPGLWLSYLNVVFFALTVMIRPKNKEATPAPASNTKKIS